MAATSLLRNLETLKKPPDNETTSPAATNEDGKCYPGNPTLSKEVKRSLKLQLRRW